MIIEASVLSINAFFVGSGVSGLNGSGLWGFRASRVQGLLVLRISGSGPRLVQQILMHPLSKRGQEESLRCLCTHRTRFKWLFILRDPGWGRTGVPRTFGAYVLVASLSASRFKVLFRVKGRLGFFLLCLQPSSPIPASSAVVPMTETAQHVKTHTYTHTHTHRETETDAHSTIHP